MKLKSLDINYGDIAAIKGTIIIDYRFFNKKIITNLYSKNIDLSIFNNADHLKSFFTNFSGNVRLYTDKLRYDNFSIENVALQTVITFGNIGLISFKGDTMDGKLDVAGNISTYPFLALMSYALNNASLKGVVNKFAWLPQISGVFSIAGTLGLAGNNIQQLMDNSQVSATVAIREANIKGMGLDDLYNVIVDPSVGPAELSQKLPLEINKGETEFGNIDAQFTVDKKILSILSMTFNTKSIAGNANGSIALDSGELIFQSKMSLVPEQNHNPISFGVTAKNQFTNLTLEYDIEELLNYTRTKHN
jgi:hypothetical protein